MKVPYGKQHVTAEDIDVVVKILQSDFLTQGPAVEEFEKVFSSIVAAPFAVAFNNATAALHLAYKVLKRSSKKVLVTPLTFVASSNCVLYEGGSVEFVDIDPRSFNMDLNLLEDKLKSKPNEYEGMIVVDFAGLPVDMKAFRGLADKYNLWIIEDACHALGGSADGVPTGSSEYSDVTIFSFHPVKHVATGEGGMATTKDEKIWKKLNQLRSHGMERNPDLFQQESHGGWYHEMQELGYNYRMPDINAALGTSQVNRLKENIQARNRLATRYGKSLSQLPIKFQHYDSIRFHHAYHLFVILTERRRELYDFLRQQNIFTQVHYLPIYLHPYYSQLGFKRGLCPNAESYYQSCLSLPMYHSMTDQEHDYVLEKLHAFFH